MSEISFRAVGDNLLHSHVYNAYKQADGSYAFNAMYEHIKDTIKSADIAVVNQETVFVGDQNKYSSFPFFATPEFVGDALVNTGFNVVTHATNHSMDKWRAGLTYTIDYWETNHPEITVLGIRKHKTKQRFCVIEKNGIKLAMFNYTRSLNYHPRPLGGAHMIDLLKPHYKGEISAELKQARELADIVVVFVHWGIEYEYTPCDNQREWTQLFLNCGVDIVIGTHPHVVQPMVKMERPGGSDMVVYYSLGNFISGQQRIPRLLGGLADITIVKKNGIAYISQCSLLPLITHVEPGGTAYKVYLLSDYTDDLAKKHHIANTLGLNNVQKQTFYDLFHKILHGEIAGEPNSILHNAKAVISNMIIKRR